MKVLKSFSVFTALLLVMMLMIGDPLFSSLQADEAANGSGDTLATRTADAMRQWGVGENNQTVDSDTRRQTIRNGVITEDDMEGGNTPPDEDGTLGSAVPSFPSWAGWR